MRNKLQGLWNNPNFVKLWAGQTISEFGSRITREGLPLTAIYLLSATPFQLGLMLAIATAPVLMVGLLAGVWVDRIRRRPILIFADLGRALLVFSVPLAAFLNLLTVWQIYLVIALTGVLTVFFEVANQAFLPALVSREHILEGNTKLGASCSLAEIGGPAIAGSLIQFLTAPIAMIIDALTFLCSAIGVGLIRIPEPPPPPPEERQSAWKDMVEGLQVIRNHPSLRILTAASTLRSFFGSFIGAVYVLYAVKELGMTPAILGLCIMMGGIGSLVGALFSGKLVRRFGFGATLTGSIVIEGGALLCMPLAQGPGLISLGLFMVAQLLGDGGQTVYSLNTLTFRQMVVPDRLLGRANASVQVMVEGVSPVGALVGGLLAETLGMRFCLSIAVTGILISALWLVFSPLRKLQNQPQSDQQEAKPIESLL